MRDAYMVDNHKYQKKGDLSQKSEEELDQFMRSKMEEGLTKILKLIHGKFKPIGNFNSMDKSVETSLLDIDIKDIISKNDQLIGNLNIQKTKNETLNNKLMINHVLIEE